MESQTRRRVSRLSRGSVWSAATCAQPDMLHCREHGANTNAQPSPSPQRSLENDIDKTIVWVTKDRDPTKLVSNHIAVWGEWIGQGIGLDGLDKIAESIREVPGTPLAGRRDRSGQTPSTNERRDIVAAESRLSLNRDGFLADTVWNISALLDLTDSVRWSLVTNKALGPMESRLTALLDVVLANEALKTSSASRLLIDFDTIMGARLDKLIEALLDKSNQPSRPVPVSFFAAKTAAGVLQRKWQLRFREAYVSLDRFRYHQMLTGHLVEISFSAPGAGVPDSPALWRETRRKEAPTEPNNNRRFYAGHWWLNIVCAHRDGIAGSARQVPARGRNGVVALPLLSGREEVLENGRSIYIRESSLVADMHVSLMTKVGQRIKILRGSQLRSIYAPSGGLRYDGLYTIVQYGHKLNEDIEMYRLALVLERVPGQKSMMDLKAVPKPSQLDDWRLYERFEGEKLKSTVGRKNYLAWKTKKMKDKLEHEQWLVSIGLKIGYPHWRTTQEDDIKQKATSKQGRRQAISSR
ncbi:hypothetical protein GGTG_03917 [Gaeumannomyces tritici R3-111a-1]|uniref:YDG domain-containing protein n=1 Tax=Gaeumannomyces tritici (strain R3-111a-1) TaxID=644352 RepID=J3NRL5_GAET3|nr:hypothetical protein GGTG_03917 [Gaeumannomyces tritici R3-111a-1]EJT78821.1 hypothetical protein GGTG_03917 [Gaeumannomyces tritici R3-111a-1]